MIESSEKYLTRPLGAVKKLSGDVRLDTYYKDIKPFLFGTDSTTTITRPLPSNGIHNKVNSSGIIPGSSPDINIKVSGKGLIILQRADIFNEKLILDLKFNPSVNGSNYLFPSDLLSILVSLAKVFKKEGYGGPTLKSFAAKDPIKAVDGFASVKTIDVVKKVDGEDVVVDTKKEFFEKDVFSKNGSSIKTLLDEIVDAAIEYEEDIEPIDHSAFLLDQELKKQITQLIIPKILDRHVEYKEKIKDNPEEKIKSTDLEIKNKIDQLLSESNFSYISDKLLTNKNLKFFAEEKIYYQLKFKLSKDKNGSGILDTNQYLVFEKEVIDRFLEKHEDEITSKYIDPLFKKEKEIREPVTAPEVDGDGGDEIEDESTEENFTIQRDQVESQASVDLANAILNNFINQIDNERFEAFRANFLENTTVKDQIKGLSEDITEKTNKYISSSNFIPTTTTEELLSQNLLNLEGVFVNNILETEWYQKFISEFSLDRFLATQSSNYYNILLTTHISPILDILESDEEPPEPPTEAETQDAKTATVPTIEETQATTTQSTEDREQQPQSIRQTQEQLIIQADSIYENVILQVFTAHGLSESDLTLELRGQLRADAITYTLSLSDYQKEQLFIDSQLLNTENFQNQHAAIFYQSFSKNNIIILNNFYNSLNQNKTWKDLSANQKKNFISVSENYFKTDIKILKFKDSSALLKSSLKEILNSDSAVLNKNVIDEIETLIIFHGINPENKLNAIWVIENYDPKKLQLLLNLPLDQKTLNSLKQILIAYTHKRAAELARYTQSKSVLGGLDTVDRALDTKADQEQFSNSLRGAVRAYGGKTVAGGLDHKKNSDRESKVNEIANRYETQRQDPAAIRNQIEIIIAIQEQLAREEAYSNMLKAYYSGESDGTELHEIENTLGFFDDQSMRDIYAADQPSNLASPIIQEGQPTGRAKSLRTRFKNSRLGKRLTKRFSAKEKIKKKAKKKLSRALEKSTATAVSGVAALTGVGTVPAAALKFFSTIGWEKSAIFVAAATSILGGGLIGLAKRILDLSLGTGGSSSVGAARAFNAGSYASKYVAGSKNTFTAKAAGATQTAITTQPFIPSLTSAKITLVATATKAATLPTAILAPAGAFLITAGMTLFIVFMIQSSFLIPIPDNFNTGFGGDIGALGPNGFECFVFGEGNKQIFGQSGSSLISKEWTVDEKQRTYDAYTRKAGRNQCFNSYACDNGTVTLYRAEHPTFGGWTPGVLKGDVIILYDLPFQDPKTGVPYTSIRGLEYTFIHELGHSISFRGANDFINSFQQIWNGNHCLTYPILEGCSVEEAFAEAIALYVNYDTYKYKFSNGIKLSIKTPYDFPQQAPEEYEWVKNNIFDNPSGSCEGLIEEAQNSYIAIGPLTRDNIVASSAQEMRNPQLTCNWSDVHNLAAAVNANFFNTDETTNRLTPVGLAGNPEVQYYEDATITSINDNLKTFGFEGNTPLTINGGHSALKSNQIPLNLAVTGSFSETQVSAESKNKRTLLGTGIANSKCSQEYAGQRVLFLAVYTSSTFTEAEKNLAECGATDFIHLDGGGSSQFCSDESSYKQNRFIPVNIGMKEAEIIEGK